MRPVIFIFPGQSSRDSQMFARLAEVMPAAAEAALADYARLRGAAFNGRFECNRDIQLSVVLATRVYCQFAKEAGLVPVASAGLSLGEYTHLAEVGAIGEWDLLSLIAARGAAYDAGPSGTMAVVQPCAEPELQRVLDGVRQRLELDASDLGIASFNSGKQFVVAGRGDAVEAAAHAAEAQLFAMTRVIEARIPMHVGRFEPAAADFRPSLEAVTWRAPHAQWWSNVLGAAVPDCTQDSLVELMTRHVYEPVRWHALVDALIDRHPDAVFVEVGPHSVLTDLIRSGWRGRNVTALALDPGPSATRGDFEQQLRRINDARH